MLTKIEILARSIVRNVYAQTSGRPIQWRMLHQICAGLGADSEDSIEAAMLLAIERGWLEQRDGQYVDLTDEGRRLAGQHQDLGPKEACT